MIRCGSSCLTRLGTWDTYHEVSEDLRRDAFNLLIFHAEAFATPVKQAAPVIAMPALELLCAGSDFAQTNGTGALLAAARTVLHDMRSCGGIFHFCLVTYCLVDPCGRSFFIANAHARFEQLFSSLHMKGYFDPHEAS